MSAKEYWEGKTASIPNSWIIVTLFVLFFTSIGFGVRNRYNLPGMNLDEDVGLDLTADDVAGDDFAEGPSGTDYVRNMITIDFEIDESDWQSGAAATPTSPVYAYFYEQPVEDESGTGITVAGEDITIKASNDGIIWIDAYGGTDFYLVEQALKSANPEIMSIVTNDYDNDDQLDFLIKLDMSDYLKEDFQFKPTYVMEMPLLDVDVAAWDDDNPADQTALGEVQVTTTVTWAYLGLNADDGAVISDLVIKTNDTEKGNDITLKTLTISGTHTICDWRGRVLSGSALTLSPVTTYIGGAYAAYYTLSADVDDPLDSNALMFYRDTNAGDMTYFTLSAQLNYETSDTVTVTIEFTLTSPDGTTAEETDVVSLFEWG